jgi:DNA-binding HxlR family transcriptional regulator
MALKIRNTNKMKDVDDCPIGEAMDLLGGAWTPKVIWHLIQGPRRFTELKIYLSPISAKMLSQRLKDLEDKGVVSRNVAPTKPPSVEYGLTELGYELLPAIEEIGKIGAKLKRRKLELA